MQDLIGHDIGRYHILEQLGQGGMAVVYKAYDTRLEREVAVKLIRKGQFGTDYQAHMLKRFEREARSLAKMLHPNIVPIYDYGEHDGAPYLVMAYIPGGTLKQRTTGQVPYPQAARMLAPMARALEYAHQREIIHRDVKPANILITEEGIPMLSDFGVAKILESEEGGTLTGTGVGVGTPEYMAPEQWVNKVVPQTDIYSLGVVFYELVTGRKPYTADTPAAVLIKQTTDPLPRPKEFVPGLPDGVEQVIFKAMAKKPEERYASMGEFAAALDKLGLQAEPRKASKPVPVMAGPGSKPIKENPPAGASHPGPDETWDPGQTGVSPGAVKRGGVPVWAYLVGGVVVLGMIAGGVMLGLGSGSGKAAPAPTATALPPTPAAVIPTLTQAPAVEAPQTSLPAPTVQAVLPMLPVVIKTEAAPKDGMTMVYVPQGDFLMGTNDGGSDAKPVHTVYLDAFWIDQTEVTNAMYEKCVTSGSCNAPHDTKSNTHPYYYNNSRFANYPVIYVDWSQADAYCKWAGRRLPTEAEWEKAARGTDGRSYPWGEGIDNNMANYATDDTTAVGSYPGRTSPYGVLDMAGNVWEWVSDWYGSAYYASSPAHNPAGPFSGDSRVLRGGSWSDYNGVSLKTPVRYWYVPTIADDRFGFRCAQSAGAPAAAPTPAAAAKMVIPVISKGYQHQFWQAVKAGTEKAAAELKLTTTFEGPETEAMVDQQLQMLQAAIDKKPAAICFAAVDSRAAVPLLQKAKAAKIPVIAFDSGVDSDIPLSTTATDNAASAALAADKMAALIGGSGKVALMVHDQTSRSGIDRVKGFLDEMKLKYPQITVLPVQQGKGDPALSESIATGVIQANPDLKGYFGANEGSIAGILNAVKNLKMEGRLVLVGYDSGQQQMDAIRAGTEAGAITQDPFGMGYACIQAAVKAARGETLPSFIDSGYHWYDQTKLDDPAIAALLYK